MNRQTAQPLLVFFAKAPQLGEVKTRLAADLGSTHATTWYRTTCARVIRTLSRDTRWRTVLAVSPDKAAVDPAAWPEVWPAHVRRMPQGSGDLGARMERVFHASPPGPVVIVGSDIPGITPALIHDAFRALGRADAVLGPCPDGGYWAIGLKRRKAETNLFGGVRWSTPFTLQDTVAALGDRRIAYLETLNDVDTIADLQQKHIP